MRPHYVQRGRDRHTMIDFYLLAMGIVAAGVVNVLKTDGDALPVIGTVLLWLLCVVGWLYFFEDHLSTPGVV